MTVKAATNGAVCDFAGHENLLRQIHPDRAGDNTQQISRTAFLPTPNDNGKLSVDDGSQVSAKDSFLLYTRSKKSGMVVSICVSSLRGVSFTYKNKHYNVILPAKKDPIKNNPYHCYIYFGFVMLDEKIEKENEIPIYKAISKALSAKSKIEIDKATAENLLLNNQSDSGSQDSV